MRVEVDTKHDHPDHIRQVVHLLQSILDGQQTTSTVSPQTEPVQTYSTQQSAQQGVQESSSEASGGIFDIFSDNASSQQEENKTDDTVRIIQY